MSFVGTRPEVTKYVKKYTKEMRATLLLPAGITSEASIQYKDEAELLDAADDVDRVYVEKVLPEKINGYRQKQNGYLYMRIQPYVIMSQSLRKYWIRLIIYTKAKVMEKI